MLRPITRPRRASHRSPECSRSTCRSSTRYPRTTRGGDQASPSGRTSPSARPLFRGHVQPNLPADLGFYDLRLPETRTAQADLAARHGVEAFCYWHYWFAGTRLLERPFDEVLASGEPGLPLLSRVGQRELVALWTGAADRVLIEQTYPGPRRRRAPLPCDAARVLVTRGTFGSTASRCSSCTDRQSLPSARAFADQWRALADANGLPGLYLVGETTGRAWHAADDGFDADTRTRRSGTCRRDQVGRDGRACGSIGSHIADGRTAPYRALATRLARRACSRMGRISPPSSRTGTTRRAGSPRRRASRERPPSCSATPSAVQWTRSQGLPSTKRIVFVKSWNEWAEGNYLEPDRRFGHQYLRALKNAISVPR